MKRRLVILSLLVLLIATGIAFLVQHLRKEPEFEGRPLSTWIGEVQSLDAERRLNAERALKAMGAEAVPRLASELESREGILYRGYRKMGDHLPEMVKKPLRKIFRRKEDFRDKVAVAKALQVIGTNSQAAIPALGKMLRDPHAHLSSVAGATLGQIGSAAVPVLLQALEDGDYIVRANACSSLAALGTNAAPAVTRLCKILESETGPIVSSASYTLSRIGPPAVGSLTNLLSNTNWVVRRWSAYALGNMLYGGEAAIGALVPLMSDTNHQVRWTAVQALARIGIDTPEAEAAALSALDDPDPNIRASAGEAFSNRPSLVMVHMDRCIALLDDESPLVRANAAFMLGQAGHFSLKALPKLEKVAGETNALTQGRARQAIESIRQSALLVQQPGK